MQDNGYEAFLCRMIAYRDRMNMSQKEVGRIFGKNQSQQSKMELGKTLFAYEMLKCLWNSGWDIDHIVTDVNTVVIENRISGYLNSSMANDWKCFGEILIWILNTEFCKRDFFSDKPTEFEYKLLKLLLSQNEPVTVMFAIRSIRNVSQVVMAEELGVNIKKYCRMEKGKCFLDAELLVLLYQIYHCRPSLFFSSTNLEEYLLDSLWNQLDAMQQEEAMKLLNAAIALCKAE